MKKRETVLGPDAVAVVEYLAEVKDATIPRLMARTGFSRRRVIAALKKLKKQKLITTVPVDPRPAFGRTPHGQLLYDLAFTDMLEKSIARKHKMPIAEVRHLRELPPVQKLRKQLRGAEA